MEIGVYWVGQVPSNPLVMQVRNDRGRPVDLSDYDEMNLIMLGSDNEDKDTSGGTLNVLSAVNGRVQYNWPSESLFNKHGDYIVQLELIGPGVRDYSTPGTITVRKLGRRDR